ncbi:Ribosomal protein S12 methylthiotransferase RimO [bioreactor metagenome]|uniref:Ribosomal protein S12 methylthiotransferase RimO n=1 Tax=bioreactor metagenome TaxID=1076179 RepID=A0A645CZ53_9ZZZZ
MTMGCPKNQTDTELMLSRLEDAGIEIVDEDIKADIMIVNTCAFIKSAKEESIEAILDLGWLKQNRNLKGIIVTGCMAQRYFEQIKKELPEADAVLGLGAESEIAETVKKLYETGEGTYECGAPEELVMEGGRILSTPDYYAYLKISEGCDNRCSYCAIPSIRGAHRSRTMESILEEAKLLSENGVKELCLVAQDTTRYGLDLYGEYKLADLLEALCTTPGINFEWIRLLYCYPDKITDRLCEVMAKYSMIAKYIDLPIQHISDHVLEAMNRHGGAEIIRSAIERLRSHMPEIMIRTTVMVGFPGETDKDFALLNSFVRDTLFGRLGAFEYSREENTAAYMMPKQISAKTKAVRLDNIMNTQYTVAQEINSSYIGRTVRVLCESYDNVSECYFGRTEAHAPEIDGGVYFTSRRKIPAGEFVSVLIKDVCDYDLTGRETGK